MNDQERMLSGTLYDPGYTNAKQWLDCRLAVEAFNSLGFLKREERTPVLQKIFGQLPDDAVITPPFYCDRGSNIYVGRHFYANTGLLILDEAKVQIGDHNFFGPRVCIYTACHPLDAEIRNLDLEYALPVTIGDNCWIGGNVIINPGVEIGEDCVIGSGSVVTKNIPPHSVAAGNPCRVLRSITKEDAAVWQKQYQMYLEDPDTRKHFDPSN